MIRGLLWLLPRIPPAVWFALKWLWCVVGFWHRWEATDQTCCSYVYLANGPPLKKSTAGYFSRCAKCGLLKDCGGFPHGYP